jgi:hypothetical protein
MLNPATKLDGRGHIQEAIRETRALSQTLRRGISNPERQSRLRDMLLEIEFELQKDE